jgi:methylenetetrahydrofolate dehydrogenase (NADP+) / methenyltetrahydrofolate cyclohydrolase
MTTLVDGRKLADQIREELRIRIAELPESRRPGLATVLVGSDPASHVYVRNKRRACKQVGIRSVHRELPETISESELLAEVDRLNADPGVHGILVQLPLPADIDPGRIAERIAPAKDVDGLHPRSAGALLAGRPSLVPCTPRGCIEILDRHGVKIEGARAVVVGRSDIVGKPIGLLLLHRSATVTFCHSRTRDLPEVVAEAEILVVAMGRPRAIRGEWIRAGAAVLDVGVNRLPEGLVGDVDFDSALGRAGLLTPVPGGVGPLTIVMLLSNTLAAFCAQAGGAQVGGTQAGA